VPVGAAKFVPFSLLYYRRRSSPRKAPAGGLAARKLFPRKLAMTLAENFPAGTLRSVLLVPAE
jgi:hypothetical protein